MFVGQNERFNRPVTVSLGKEPAAKVLGDPNAELMAFVVSGGLVLGREAHSYTDPPKKP